MKRMLTIEADISSAWIILKQHDYHLLAKSHTLLLLNILLLFSGGGKQQQISTVSNYSQLICQLARRNIYQMAKQGIILMKADQNRLQEIFPPI